MSSVVPGDGRKHLSGTFHTGPTVESVAYKAS